MNAKEFEASTRSTPADRRLIRAITKPVRVFKKVYVDRFRGATQCIAVLELPVGTLIRHNGMYRGKMRASKARVVKITKIWAGKQVQRARAGFDQSFTYVRGKVAYPVNPFDTSNCECTSGIHFFRTITEARNW